MLNQLYESHQKYFINQEARLIKFQICKSRRQEAFHGSSSPLYRFENVPSQSSLFFSFFVDHPCDIDKEQNVMTAPGSILQTVYDSRSLQKQWKE